MAANNIVSKGIRWTLKGKRKFNDGINSKLINQIDYTEQPMERNKNPGCIASYKHNQLFIQYTVSIMANLSII